MSNRNRSNKRQTKPPIWPNDHVIGNSSQNRKDKVDMSNGKGNSVQNLETNVVIENTDTGEKGGVKKNVELNTGSEVVVNVTISDPTEVMSTEIDSNVSNSIMNENNGDKTVVSENNVDNTAVSEKNVDIDTTVSNNDAGMTDNCNDKYKIDTSYANMVKKDEFPKELMYIPTQVNENGNEVVVFDEMLVKNGSERWRLTACGQFIGYNMHISELRYNIRIMWSKFGITDISASKNGQYLFKFRDIEGLNAVIDKGPWMVQNKPLFIQKWSPEIGMQIIEPKKVPVWVKMTNVPLEAWSMKGISALASSLGKPIVMNTKTTAMCYKGVGNLDYARVLVEIDADKEIKHEIEIQYKDKENNVKGVKK